MIVTAIIKALLAVFLFVLALCSFGFAATWAAKLVEYSDTVVPLAAKIYNYLFDMGAWVPGKTMLAGLVMAAAIVTSQWCIKIGRMVLSLFTGGGGSAA